MGYKTVWRDRKQRAAAMDNAARHFRVYTVLMVRWGGALVVGWGLYVVVLGFDRHRTVRAVLDNLLVLFLTGALAYIVLLALGFFVNREAMLNEAHNAALVEDSIRDDVKRIKYAKGRKP